VLPCLIFEDEHLLVVNKPPGLNTHAPSPCAGEGLYEWLRHHEPAWSGLAIIHRLDKETSGVIVFSKTSLANRSLTEQFTKRVVRKKYLLLTDRVLHQTELSAKSSLVRTGEKYVSRPLQGGGQVAETRFRRLEPSELKELASTSGLRQELSRAGPYASIEAEPLTGRTHQIRVHAADKGFPILGDTLYGGTPAPRVFLHATELSLRHPASGQPMTFRASLDFTADARLGLRSALLDPEETDAYRLVHGASDGWPGWYVDRLGAYLLSQSEQPLSTGQHQKLEGIVRAFSAHGAYHKLLVRQVRNPEIAQVSPRLILGQAAPQRFTIRENGLQFELGFHEGYSVGLFLDQRENRRRLLTGHIAAHFPLFGRKGEGPSRGPRPQILNAFAYTCAFSVGAAKTGARITSLDLSRKYLEWGKRNFTLNQLDPAEHDFIYGDVFDWLRRFKKKDRHFEVVLLDPPTFSQSKEHGVFRAQKDYGRLVAEALPLVMPGGVLFCSTNAADWAADDFLTCIEDALRGSRRKILQKHYVPQPPDFPISRPEPAYLKTVWMRLE
jgi:23S rRNA (cytosine1962-C5)-methyltransferase